MMIKRFLLVVLLLSFNILVYGQETIEMHTDANEEYLLFSVQTNYNGLSAGSVIVIAKPEVEKPEIIKPTKKEDFSIRIVKELNTLAKSGWKIVSSHHKTFELSGSSGTFSDATVYLMKRAVQTR
jgi:hypothetical protein